MYRKATIKILALLIGMVAPLSAASAQAAQNNNFSQDQPSASNNNIHQVSLDTTESVDGNIDKNVNDNAQEMHINNRTHIDTVEQLQPIGQRNGHQQTNSQYEEVKMSEKEEDEHKADCESPTSGAPDMSANVDIQGKDPTKGTTVATGDNNDSQSSGSDEAESDSDNNVINNGETMVNQSNQQNSSQYIILRGLSVVGSCWLLWTNFYPASIASSAPPTSPVTPVLTQKPNATSVWTTSTLQPVQDKENTLKLVIFFIWLILGVLCFGLWASRKYGKR